jgi:hypothetical protein
MSGGDPTVGWWQVNADTLAGGRFVISPLAEATAALITLARGAAAHPQERAWLDAHLPAYRDLLAGDPVVAALVHAGLTRRWIAELFTQPPAGDPVGDSADAAFAAEAARIRAIPLDAALADLSVAVGGPVPAILIRPDLPQQAAGLLRWVWAQTVAPDWQRRRRILEADIVARTADLAQGGWSAALAGMRPGMRWLGDGRLRINGHDVPPREISGARLFFVPVTQSCGWVAWDQPGRYAVMYPCAGVLADPAAEAPQALRALLGPGRARALVLLDTPKSTTQLVALTGQPLGSVGRHLKVLHAAGLLGRSRAGRSVLYYRTAAGDSLVEAQHLKALEETFDWHGVTASM